MAEYIEREELIKKLNEAPAYFDSGDIRYGIDIAIQQVVEHPTADVVPVVRCEDCVYWDGLGYSGKCEGYHNGLMRNYTNYDDYCSYGERKDSND